MQTLPLYHWFVTSPSHSPFNWLDMRPSYLALEMEKIRDLQISHITKRYDSINKRLTLIYIAIVSNNCICPIELKAILYYC